MSDEGESVELITARVQMRVQALLVEHGIPAGLLPVLHLLVDDEMRAQCVEVLSRVDVPAFFAQLHAVEREAWPPLLVCARCGSDEQVNRLRSSHDPLCIACRSEDHNRPSQPAANVLANALARARKAERPATLTAEQWARTVEHFNDRCAYCEGPWAIIEHAIPIALGGGTTVTNCLPACTLCNGIKGPKTLSALIARRASDFDRTFHDRLQYALAWLQQRDVHHTQRCLIELVRRDTGVVVNTLGPQSRDHAERLSRSINKSRRHHFARVVPV